MFAEFGVAADATQAQANRRLVYAFYGILDVYNPADTIIYIPPPESIHPKLSEEQQAFVFADYAVRKIAPIVFDAAGLKAEAAKLRKLPEIVDNGTVEAAFDVISFAREAATVAAEARAAHSTLAIATADIARRSADGAVSADVYYDAFATEAAAAAAVSAQYAAKLNPEATWDAVTTMLYAL
jgi:hypothetical protein